jgi:quinoprotein glucose dehydrogenase
MRFVSAIFILCGLLLALPGAILIGLGGSPYYAASGIALAISGVLLWRARLAGAWVFAALLVLTCLWALWEAGPDGWAMVPRLSLFALLAVLLLFALWRQARGGNENACKCALQIALACLVALMTIVMPLAANRLDQPEPGAVKPVAFADSPADWAYVGGGDAGSRRYSGLDQITPANVSKLQLAWKIHLGTPPSGMGVLEGTPLMVDGTVFMCNMHNQVMAIDPDSGTIRWRFDPKIDPTAVILGVCRGVAFHRQPGAVGLCSTRIISLTLDARMFALDAKTGRRCPDFGNNGEVDLGEGLGAEKAYYSNTSNPLIVRGKVIVGGFVLDVQHVNEPSGVIRGFDAISGNFAWAWDMGRPGAHGMPPPGQTFTPGTPNAWAPLTGDEARGLAFVPLGNATPDYVTAHRTPVMNKFTDAVVALDVETGNLRWSFQTTRRDVWDYDNASPPTLVDFPTPAGMRPAVIQPTKRGQFFVLDRETGKPLVQTADRRVPQDPVPGETLSPTQPYAVGMPSFGGPRLTEADMWGMTAFDQLWCRIKFREARYDGEFTPIGLEPTIVYPGYLGGSEWAGVAVDPVHQLMVLNVNHFAMYNRMITRVQADKEGIRAYRVGGPPIGKEDAPQMGTPYAVKTSGFVTPLGTPCIKPPYSELAVVDLRTRKVVWRQPLGTARDSGPLNLKSMLPIKMGVPAVGGPLVTGSGLIFIAATQERSFRAFDLHTGKRLWESRLPAGGHAAPMTYFSRRTSRQYVLIPASGHFWMKSGSADYLLAYALPPEGNKK